MADTLKLILLGKMQAMMGDAPVSGFISTKAQALLAYLAVTRRPHTRDALSALFWGEMGDADAKTNLRQALANLKKLVESHVIIARDSVAFDLAAPHQMDVGELDGLRFDETPTSQPANLQTFVRAVAHYRGDLLEGLVIKDAPEFEEWLVMQRERYRGLALRALIALADFHMAHGRTGLNSAIEYASRALALDPWREEEHRRLMILLARVGQRSAALAQFEKCRDALKREFGIEPSLETRTAYERIKLAGETPRARLPVQSTPFIGRETEISTTLHTLTNARLVTLVGPGGIGKTRIALEVAAQTKDDFINGVCFVALSPVSSPDRIVTAISESLRLTSSSGANPGAQLQNYLREKEMLLVLDNIEHLLSGVGALAEVLSAAPLVKILVTSRERLNLRGEKVIALEGMAYPSTAANLDDLGTFASAQLFIGRSREANDAFDPLPNDAMHIARICQLVQGMPLGIELAAAWTRSLTCEEIVREIERSLDFLESGMRDVPERQRSLRAVFEHSWRMLSSKEQNAFARLSVFRGGCTRQAAEAVAGATSAVLMSLVDKSMLKRAESGRYELHEVMRQYGEAKLKLIEIEHADTHEHARMKHCAFYLEAVATKSEALQTNAQHAALQALRPELANIQSAWRFGVETGAYDDLDRALEGYERLCVLAERYAEIRDACERLVKSVRTHAVARPKLETHCLMAEANVLNMLTTGELALVLAQEAVALARTHGLVDILPKVLGVAAIAARDDGQRDLAKSLVREAMQRQNDNGAIRDVDRVSTYWVAAHIAYDAGDYKATQDYARQSLALSERAGDLYGSTRAMSALANAANYLGDYAGARVYLERILEILELLGNTYQVALARYNLGLTEYFLQHTEAAWTHFEHFERSAQDYGDINGMGLAANGLAMLNNTAGAYDAAVLRCEQAIERCQTTHERYAAVYLYQTLGEALIHLGRTQDAADRLYTGLAMAMDTKLVPGALHILLGYAQLLPRERAILILDFILNHPGVIRFTHERALDLWQQYTTRLTPEQIADIRAHSTTQTLEGMARLVSST